MACAGARYRARARAASRSRSLLERCFCSCRFFDVRLGVTFKASQDGWQGVYRWWSLLSVRYRSNRWRRIFAHRARSWFRRGGRGHGAPWSATEREKSHHQKVQGPIPIHARTARQALPLSPHPSWNECCEWDEMECFGRTLHCPSQTELSQPVRWSCGVVWQGGGVAEIGIIFNCMLKELHGRWGSLLYGVDGQAPWLTPERFALYRERLKEFAPTDTIFGFIDGTVRPICRPGHHQKVVYNGHKRTHALKYQAIMTPDGMVSHLFWSCRRKAPWCRYPYREQTHRRNGAAHAPSSWRRCLRRVWRSGIPASTGNPLPICQSNRTGTSLQCRDEQCQRSSGVGFRENHFSVCFPWFQKKSKSEPPTRRTAVQSSDTADQLPHVPQWFSSWTALSHGPSTVTRILATSQRMWVNWQDLLPMFFCIRANLWQHSIFLLCCVTVSSILRCCSPPPPPHSSTVINLHCKYWHYANCYSLFCWKFTYTHDQFTLRAHETNWLWSKKQARYFNGGYALYCVAGHFRQEFSFVAFVKAIFWLN